MRVGLFSSHANELRKARKHLRATAGLEKPIERSALKRKSQPRISDEKCMQIVSGYEEGKTVYELASEYGCHRATISVVLNRRGVSIRGSSPTAGEADEMIRLYGSGLSLAKVGDRFGVHASTVLAQLRKAGVKTRDAHGQVR